MQHEYNNKRSKFRRSAILALLLGLFVSQSYLAAHSADFDAHDNELCEICLGFNSPNKPIALSASVALSFNIAVDSFEAKTDVTPSAAADASCHAIRAPPVPVTS